MTFEQLVLIWPMVGISLVVVAVLLGTWLQDRSVLRKTRSGRPEIG